MPEPGVARDTRTRWILLALAAWTVLAAIPTSSAYIAEGSLGLGRWLRIFTNIAPYYYLWGLATPGIYRVSMSWLSPERGWLQAIAGHAALALALSLVFGFLLHFDNWPAWLYGQHAAGYYAMSSFSYVFILLGIYLYALNQKLRAQEALIAEQRERALRLEASLARAQVELLRGQMNPHFLFNALNCIGALIETRRNDQAYEALEDLGSLLRTSLEHRNQDLVPLGEELAFARRYVAMEQVRFGERLRIHVDVDSATAQWMVPPFILQPLIENTVKHAVAPSRSVVNIEVTGKRVAGGIELSVIDDGGGNQPGSRSSGTGVGLESLRKRLALIYGDQARMDFMQDTAGTRVSLYLPDQDHYSARKAKDQELADQGDQIPFIRRPRGVEV